MARALLQRSVFYQLLLVAAGASLVPGSAVLAASAQPAADAAPSLLTDYWRQRSELTVQELRALPLWCDGGYRQLAFAHPRDVDAATLPIDAEATEATYFVDERLELSGDVVLRRGNRTVRTAAATVDEATEQAQLRGRVQIEEPGLVLLGESADVDLANESAELADVTYLLTEGGFRGTAARVAQSNGGDLRIERGSVTRCEPGSNTWRIDARSIDVEDGAVFGTARGAVVRVKDVPLFYLPYMRFPITDDRQSGWLFPALGYSAEDGFDFAAPYYLNLARNYDATLTPRILTNRGGSLEAELRHLSRFGDTVLGGALLPSDREFNGELSRDDFFELNPNGEFKKADRWLYALDHHGLFERPGGGRWQTTIDYTAVSDADYFRDLGTDLSVSSRIELERRAELQYQHGNLSARLWAQRFQRLDEITTDAYQRVPQFDLTYDRRLVGPLRVALTAQAAAFDRDNEALSGLARVVGERFHLQPELRLPLTWPFAFANFAAGLRYTSYDLRDVPAGGDPTPTRSIGYGHADTGLFFERNLRLFGRDLLQTLEPRLYYLYNERARQDELPRFDVTQLTFGYSQLFRSNRFSGLDRIGDANQLSVGLSSAFVDARTGRELLRASVGEIFYLRDRSVTLAGAPVDDDRHSSSALAAEVRGSLVRNWQLNGTLIWDPQDNQVDESAMMLVYRRSNRRIVNLGFRNRRLGDVDQTDVSVVWPLSRKWGVLGRWNYDLKQNRTIEGFAGLEYNDCCWQFRLVARRFIENPSNLQIDRVRTDKGVFLQIVFKGLAGFGGRLDNVLQRGIRGYSADDSTGR